MESLPLCTGKCRWLTNCGISAKASIRLSVNSTGCGTITGGATVKTASQPTVVGTAFWQNVDINYVPIQTGSQLTGNSPTRFSMGNMANAVPRNGLQMWFDFYEHKGQVSFSVSSIAKGNPTTLTFGDYVGAWPNTALTLAGNITWAGCAAMPTNAAYSANFVLTFATTTTATIPLDTSACSGSPTLSGVYVTTPGWKAGATWSPIATYDQAKSSSVTYTNYAVTAYSCTSNVLTLTVTNSLTAPVVITVNGLTTNPTFNKQWTLTSGVSSSSVALSGTCTNGSGSETGYVTVASYSASLVQQPLSNAAMVACNDVGCGYYYYGWTSWNSAGFNLNDSNGGQGTQRGMRLFDLTGGVGVTPTVPNFVGDQSWTVNMVVTSSSVSTNQIPMLNSLATAVWPNTNLNPGMLSVGLNPGSSTNGAIGVFWVCSMGSYTSYIGNTSSSYAGYQVVTNSPAMASANTPYQLTITKSTGTPSTGNTKIYINGVAQATTANTVNNNGSAPALSSCITRAQPLYVPLYQNGSHIQTTFSHYSMYNRALSAAEVARLHTVLQTQMAWRGGPTLQ